MQLWKYCLIPKEESYHHFLTIPYFDVLLLMIMINERLLQYLCCSNCSTKIVKKNGQKTQTSPHAVTANNNVQGCSIETSIHTQGISVGSSNNPKRN